MNENQQFGLLDALTIISFLLQLQNNEKLFGITDVQQDNNRIATDIHKHLTQQDEKINEIMEILKNENYRKDKRND